MKQQISLGREAFRAALGAAEAGNMDLMCLYLSGADNDSLNGFFEMLRASGAVSENEIMTLQIGIAYFHIENNPELKAAIIGEMSAEIYKHFNQGGTP